MVVNSKIPVHVSIIMDGNGRWAKERGKERYYGHAEGVESVRACTEEAIRQGVRYLSLFAFSEENWNRPEEEVKALMELMVKAMVNELPSFLKNGIRFMVIGNRARLDSALNEQIDECMRKTADCSNLSLVIFMSYSGRWDVLQAARRLALEAASDPARAEALGNMSADDFSRYLSTSGIPDPDLIIRTSGEVRLSNYLLWQCAYSELYFCDTYWPDFHEEEFCRAICDYQKRERRFGKTSEQIS